MKTLAGSIDKQLMLDEGLASVSNPTSSSVMRRISESIGLATLPAIQLWSYNG